MENPNLYMCYLNRSWAESFNSLFLNKGSFLSFLVRFLSSLQLCLQDRNQRKTFKEEYWHKKRAGIGFSHSIFHILNVISMLYELIKEQAYSYHHIPSLWLWWTLFAVGDAISGKRSDICWRPLTYEQLQMKNTTSVSELVNVKYLNLGSSRLGDQCWL